MQPIRPLISGLVIAAGLGCLKPEPIIYRVSLGMTETKLLQAVGEPTRTTAEDQGKTLEYQSMVRNWRGREVGSRAWYVHVRDGKVDRFGWRS